MPTAPYYLADGTRVPGTTTVISRFKESGGLIHWAWQLGVDGKDYRQERDSAASAGTLAHAMIEEYLNGRDPEMVLVNVEYDEATDQAIRDGAVKGFGAFQEWAEQTKLEVLAQEMHLVSEEYRFGGTPDGIGICAGKLSLLDWKTGNRIYPDHLEQLAAYRQLWHENNPKDKLESFHLGRFGKEFGDWHHHSWPSEVIDVAWESFKHKRALYELEKTLKKAAS